MAEHRPDPLPVPTPTRTEAPAKVIVKTEIELDGCHRDNLILLALINGLRANEGLEPLSINPLLSESARLKSVDIETRHYWSHNAPDGTTPWDFFNKVGYRYDMAGENLAQNFNCDEQMVASFMASPTHRDNVLGKLYKEIGIGRAGSIVTLHFGVKR